MRILYLIGATQLCTAAGSYTPKPILCINCISFSLVAPDRCHIALLQVQLLHLLQASGQDSTNFNGPAFSAFHLQVKAQTVTADGVIFNVKAAVSPAGQVVPSLTTMYSPTKQLMLMGIWGAGGSLTGAATASCTTNDVHYVIPLLVSK